MPVAAVIQLFLTGALAGLAAGFMGIGGGAVLTPLCLIVFPVLGIHTDYLVKIIFGTNMFLVMVFSFSAVMKHHHNKKIDWCTVLIMGPLAIIGSFAGAWLASISDPSALKKAFAILLLISSALIVLKGSTKPGASKTERKALLPLKLLPVLGFITGVVGSFLGIGGGVVMIPVLILVFALPVDKVAGTSSSVIIFIGLAGVFSYMWNGTGVVDLPGWSTGYVWWSAALPLAIGGIPMAQVGAMINSKLRNKVLQRIFGVVLLVIAIKMLFFS
ncbi:MAG: sulfite exporter TauE/SafE family protein [Candidatus Latescibacteria bacterium]|nr:sulfite exporter TauE/SafE family protein [Candidatus Latescibacterota bacterium]